jgi:hypothetical protein
MMCYFCLKDPLDPAVKVFFEKFQVKCLESFNLFSSPFNNKVLHIDSGMAVFKLDIAWPPLYLFGVLGVVAAAFFGLGWGWFVLPVIMCCLGLFWIPAFYVLMFKLGLKKAGYKGKVKMVSANDFVCWILWDKLKYMSS